MTEKDLKLMYRRDTGQYPDDIVKFKNWLVDEFLKSEKENYQLKLEVNKPKLSKYDDGYGPGL